MPDLPRRRLGKTGLDVSVLGYGAAPAAFLKEDAERVRDLVFSLLDQGVNLIDTATAYPGGHAFVGDHLSPRRDDFVLVSKVGRSGNPASFEPDKIHKQVDDALKFMKTDRVDVMLLHTPPTDVIEADEALGALVECREAGKVVHCGFSGDNADAAFCCRLPDIAVVECSLNVADQANVEAVLPLAKRHDVGLIVKRPIANAAWKDLDEQRGMYQKYAATYTERLAKMDLDPQQFGLTWPELALRWTLMQDGVTTAIVGTTNPDNAAKNLAIAHADPLPNDVADAVQQAFAKASDESWTGQT
jgi:aryl-alcohol dehydrogenase-like predicted oxidoreductase